MWSDNLGWGWPPATLSPRHNLKISATSQETKLIGGGTDTHPPKTQSGSKIVQLISKLSPSATFEFVSIDEFFWQTVVGASKEGLCL